MRIPFPLLILFSVVVKLSNAQDTLLTMSGNQYFGEIQDTSGVKIFFNTFKPSGKTKRKSFYRDQVFSITNSKGIEKTFYYPNLYYLDDYTVDQMRLEVYGRQDGKGFRTKWVIPLGAAVGLASGYLLEGSGLTALVPMVYTGSVQIPIVKIQRETIRNPAFIGDDFYAGGYDRSARLKRTKHALLSSFAGVIAGFALYQVTKE